MGKVEDDCYEISNVVSLLQLDKLREVGHEVVVLKCRIICTIDPASN